MKKTENASVITICPNFFILLISKKELKVLGCACSKSQKNKEQVFGEAPECLFLRFIPFTEFLSDDVSAFRRRVVLDGFPFFFESPKREMLDSPLVRFQGGFVIWKRFFVHRRLI